MPQTFASKMDRDTIIRKPDGGGVAILHMREMNSPSWAHVKQDYWIPANDLPVLGTDRRTSGRFFTDRYVTSPDGNYLLIEEMDFDGTQDSVDRHSSRLVLIDTRNVAETEIGGIGDGYCFPKRIDPDTVFYSKMRRTENGVHHEFERGIGGLTWNQLGEQGVALNTCPAVSSKRHDRSITNLQSKPRTRAGVRGLRRSA